MFNAMAFDVQGLIDAVRGLLKEEKKKPVTAIGRRQNLSECLSGAGTKIRAPFKGGRHVLEPLAKKAKDSREPTWSDLHKAYRGKVRRRRRATRGACRAGVRKAPLVGRPRFQRSAGTTASPAKKSAWGDLRTLSLVVARRCPLQEPTLDAKSFRKARM